MARPSRYTVKLGEAICKRIAEGESLRAICRDRAMPSSETVRRWLASDADTFKGFRAQYTRAREEQADFYADEIIEIADEATDVAKAKLRVDARKWKASKLAPKKYGTERQQIDHTSGGKEINGVVFTAPGGGA